MAKDNPFNGQEVINCGLFKNLNKYLCLVYTHYWSGTFHFVFFCFIQEGGSGHAELIGCLFSIEEAV